MFERIKEKVRQFRESDEWMKVQPKDLVAKYTGQLPAMTPENRGKAVNLVKWQADYFYSKTHQAIPGDVRKAVDDFAFKAERVNAHDTAKQVLEQYGSPKQALASFIGQSDRNNKYFHEQSVSSGSGGNRQAQRNENAQGERQEESYSLRP